LSPWFRSFGVWLFYPRAPSLLPNERLRRSIGTALKLASQCLVARSR